MLADIPRLSLAIPDMTLAQFWQQRAKGFSSDGNRWQASLNYAALQGLLPWMRETFGSELRLWIREAALPSVWEVVSGFALEDLERRFVILPTAAIDFAELRVPQEWIDIPSWIGDYYLSVFVNPGDGTLEVLGATTHKRIKERGVYDVNDRTYSLEAIELIADINALQLMRCLNVQETLRQPVAALPSLPATQAENLLARLGDPAIVCPRLAIPFKLWGALLDHGGWRQCLYLKRLGQPEQWIVPQWLKHGLSNEAQQWGWRMMEMQPSLVTARGSEGMGLQTLTRQLTIAGKAYNLSIFLKENDIWRFELQSNTIGGLVPGGFKLRLLTEDLLPFENNEDVAMTAVEQLYLEVQVSPGDGLVWETEPHPEDYEREILRF
jgi:hypothetical protein